MRVLVAASVCLCSTILSGCATVNEVRVLEREVLELKRTRNAPTDQQERVAELGLGVRELREELARLQGTVEQLEFAVDEIRRELASRGVVTPGRELPRGETGFGGSTPDGASAVPGGGFSQAPTPGAIPPAGGAALGGSATSGAAPAGLGAEVAAYEEAFRLYRGSQYKDAIARFREFLQTYPESGYADNALFWLGDCYFKEGDFPSAAVAFEDVAKKYPDGNKVPDALYRQGLSLIEIGAKTGQEAAYRGAAREIFEKILDRYPDSERAPEARRQLEKLGT